MWRDEDCKAQAAHLEALTALRRQLASALSDTPDAAGPPTEELVAQFKALRAAHTAEASPERSSERKGASLEAAVTTRILRGKERQAPPHPAGDGEEAGSTPLAPPLTPATTGDVAVINAPVPRPGTSAPSHRRRAAADERQLCLW